MDNLDLGSLAARDADLYAMLSMKYRSFVNGKMPASHVIETKIGDCSVTLQMLDDDGSVEIKCCSYTGLSFYGHAGLLLNGDPFSGWQKEGQRVLGQFRAELNATLQQVGLAPFEKLTHTHDPYHS